MLNLPAHKQFKAGVTAEQISELLTNAESNTFYRKSAKDSYDSLVNHALRQLLFWKSNGAVALETYEELSEDKWLLPTTTLEDVNAVREELNNGNGNDKSIRQKIY